MPGLVEPARMPANHNLPRVECVAAVLYDRSQRRPRHSLRGKDANYGPFPLESCDIQWRGVALDTSQDDFTLDRASSGAGAHRPFAFENRQTEVQGRRKRRRVCVRDKDSRYSQLRRRGREANLLRIGIAGDEHRTGSALDQDGLRARIPRDRSHRSTRHEKPILAVERADDAKRSKKDSRRVPVNKAREPRQGATELERRPNLTTMLLPHPATHARDLTASVGMLGSGQDRCT